MSRCASQSQSTATACKCCRTVGSRRSSYGVAPTCRPGQKRTALDEPCMVLCHNLETETSEVSTKVSVQILNRLQGFTSRTNDINVKKCSHFCK